MIPKELDKFASEVSEQVKEKLYAIAQSVENEVFYKNHDGYGCLKIEPIHGVGYSGFIPFQYGGFELSDYVGNGMHSGNFYTKAQEKFVNDTYDECYKQFCSDNNIEDDAELTSEQENDLSEYENDWLEPSLLRFETWLEQDNETIFLRLSIGYKDAPYYRSKYDETIKEMSFNIKDLLEMDISAIVKPFEDSI